MMGRSHAATGLAAGAATLPLLGTPDVPTALAWVAACGGAALLPDFDQGGVSWRDRRFLVAPTGSTVVTMWGWLSWAAAKLVGRLAGGHRWGTHDPLLAPAAVALLAWAAAQSTWSGAVVLALTAGAALHALAPFIPGRLENTVVGNVALSWGAAWWLTWRADVHLGWLPGALALGVAVHIAGDALTRGGVPWPGATALALLRPRARRRRWSLSLFRTGHPSWEVPITAVATVAAVVLLVRATPLGATAGQWLSAAP
ncbi:metal-dependent hydrolase [Kineococcus sp. T13]|nr:metal-dependent hydrolase [Kineococcus vitellinus]